MGHQEDYAEARDYASGQKSAARAAPPTTLEELTRRAALIVDRLGDVGKRLGGLADRTYGEIPEQRDKQLVEGPPYAGQMGELFRQLEEASLRLHAVEFAAHRLDTVA